MSDRSNIWEVIFYDESKPEYWKDILEDTKVPCICSPCHNMDVYTKFDEYKAKREYSDLLIRNLTLNTQKEDCEILLEGYNCKKSKKDSVSLIGNINRVSSKIQEIESELNLNSSEIDRLSTYVAGNTKKPHYHLIVNYGNGANKSLEQVRNDFCIPLNALSFPRIVKSERGAVRYLIHKDHFDKFQYRQDEIRVFNGYYFSDFFEISNRQMDDMTCEFMQFISDFGIMTYFDAERVTRVYRPYHKYLCGHTIFLSKIFCETEKYAKPLPEELVSELQQKLLDRVEA